MCAAQGERKVQVHMTFLLFHVVEALLIQNIMLQNPSGIRAANAL